MTELTAAAALPARIADQQPAAFRLPLLSSRFALKCLLLSAMVAGYLNALIRSSPTSQVTAFRVLFPIVTLVMFVRFGRWPIARRFGMLMTVVLAYSLAQMSILGWLRDAFVWSYLINTIAAVAFVYFVVMYRKLFGYAALYRHLLVWYLVLLVTSFHQLATGFVYPNNTFQPGHAAIFFGQQNNASLAVAAFIPLLFAVRRPRGVTFVLLLAGLVVVYINNTRGVMVAVAFYFLLDLLAPFVAKTSALSRIPIWLAAPVVLAIMVFGIFLVRDVPIRLPNEITSVNDLVLRPLGSIVTGHKLTDQLTSINLRVTLAITGLERFLATYGFGVGPGASTYFVRVLYPGVALSMHVFPLQLMVEFGWLFLAIMIWLAREGSSRVGWGRFMRIFLFCLMVTSSITSGAITNYYFFGCAVLMLMPAEGWPAPSLNFAHSAGRLPIDA